MWPAVVPYFCFSKSPQTMILKRQIYYLRPLRSEVRNKSHGAEIGVDRAEFPVKALGEMPLPCLSQLLESIYIPWLQAPSSREETGSFFHLQSRELHHTNLPSSYLLLWPWLACFCLSLIKKLCVRTSLVVQWLILQLLMQRVWVQYLVKELRPTCMPRGQKTKT